MLRRITALFNLRAGEGQPLLLLFIVHFCIASSIVFTQTASYALFLQSFNAQQLPYLYIAIAVVVSLLTTFYLRFTSRLPLARLILINLLFLAAGSLIFRVGLAAIQAAWFVFTLPIWYQ